MTRFARARGPAASNSRVEEEPTPWHELVAGLRRETVCRDVEEIESSNNEEEDDDDEEEPTSIPALDTGHEEQRGEEEEEEVKPGQGSEEQLKDGKRKRKRKGQDKCLNCKEKGHLKKECPELSEERRKELQELYQMKVERKGRGTGRKKKKKKNKEVEEEGGGAVEERPPVKDKTGQAVQDKTGQAVQEGEGLFQGFRVKMEDAKRLQSMQQRLRREEWPEEEIVETMKRERWRAERELAKFSKMVCYRCREPGHLLSDCPNGKKSDDVLGSSSGCCFKCGEKGHTSRDCKSKLSGEEAYRFAECFICKETGHLAKACPDNPRGMYPKGGGCRFCGSVEHLKADCRRKSEKDERMEVRVSTLANASRGIEEVEDDAPRLKKQRKKAAVAEKVVTF